METYDDDIIFNENDWHKVVETQTALFTKDSLLNISNQLREEFHAGHAEGRPMPEIDRTDWNTELLTKYGDREIGYDLPCLLSADRPTRGRIMLLAQDPLRKGSSPCLTVGTFFGIDNPRYRNSRKHYGAVWNLVRKCVHAGYDVLVSDALKIFVGRNQLRKDKELAKLCSEIMANEIEAYSPDKILTMGQTAGHAVSQVLEEKSFIRSPHPCARGKWYREGSSNLEEEYVKALENYYLRALFGADTPPNSI